MRVESNAAWKSRAPLKRLAPGSNPAIRTMKYLFILVVILASCKTQKAGCDAYASNSSDTTYISTNHYHIESEHKCIWIDTTVRK